MIHLLLSLLIFQYCSLFIIICYRCFFLSFSFSSFQSLYLLSFQFYFILLFISFSFSILSSQYRYSVVSVVLVFNDSLIAFAPDSPILFTVHFHLLLLFSLYHFHYFHFRLVILIINFISFFISLFYFFFLFFPYHHNADPVQSM